MKYRVCKQTKSTNTVRYLQVAPDVWFLGWVQEPTQASPLTQQKADEWVTLLMPDFDNRYYKEVNE